MILTGLPLANPQLTNQLTLKGNRAKLLHVPLWHHTYYTSTYLIDDITGELYASHHGELIAIKNKVICKRKWLKKSIWAARGKEGRYI